MTIKDIINGKDFSSVQSEIIKDRRKICYNCPIFSKKGGGKCSNELWLNPDTNEVSLCQKDGFVKGCGCAVEYKIKNMNSVCIAGKW